VIENLVFPLAGEGAPTPKQRGDRIVEAALLLNDLKPGLIKIEHPGSATACRLLANALDVPWAVLSAASSSTSSPRCFPSAATTAGSAASSPAGPSGRRPSG